MARAEAIIAHRPSVGAAWRVKRAFGVAGRAQRVVQPGGQRDRAFLRTGVEQGGVQIEPDVTILDEYAIHGFLRADGSLLPGGLVRQSCDSRGAWLRTERVGPSEDAEVRSRMHQELERVGRALFTAGYFGPFGVDAFSYKGQGGERCFQPRSEINARYTMGFSTGFGAPPAPQR
jgi:hypothetical protein